MPDSDFDCIIIGGSANGAQAAYTASKEGISVAVIEEHEVTGFPEHCSGLFSYWGLNQLDCMPPDEIVFNHDIYGSRIVSPNGKILQVRKKDKHALVCDRARFDQFLVERAKNAGSTFFQPYKALDAKRVGNLVEVEIQSQSDERIITAPLIISAEGVRGGIASKLGLQPPQPQTIVNASQFYMSNLHSIDSQLVEVIQSQKFAKDFFAWVIPMSDTEAKIGLGTAYKAASKQLEQLLKEHPLLKEHCDGAEIYRRTAGRIPFCGPVKKTVADNLILTGDVAGQTKPTTGGGVILGGIAAQIAGKTAVQAVKNSNYSNKFLMSYHKSWRKEMIWNLRLMKLVRNYMNRLSDDEVSQFFSKLEKKNILRDIEEYGHVDDQGTLVKKFMKTISLYPFYIKTSPRLVKSLFSM